MPIYVYKHPTTGVEYEDIRIFKNADKPFIAEDGVKCERVKFPAPSTAGKHGIVDKNAEGFKKDPAYYRKLKPKYVKYRDGHRERYDPNRHC